LRRNVGLDHEINAAGQMRKITGLQQPQANARDVTGPGAGIEPRGKRVRGDELAVGLVETRQRPLEDGRLPVVVPIHRLDPDALVIAATGGDINALFDGGLQGKRAAEVSHAAHAIEPTGGTRQHGRSRLMCRPSLLAQLKKLFRAGRQAILGSRDAHRYLYSTCWAFSRSGFGRLTHLAEDVLCHINGRVARHAKSDSV